MKYRPKKEEYLGFINEFSSQLSKHFPMVCFGCFGSTVNGNIVYGRSDIDGFLIMPGEVVSDKYVVRGLSQILARALSNNPVDPTFNLLDLNTVQDGRFMSYAKSFTDYFKSGKAKIISGPDYSGLINGHGFRSDKLQSASFNFSGPGGVRNIALYSFQLLNDDYDLFSERVESALDKVAKLPMKLIFLRTGKTFTNRREAQRIVQRNLPGLDYQYLDDINSLLDNVPELDITLRNSEKSLDLLYNGLEIMEQMIFAYINRHPFPGKREVGVARD